MHGKYDPLSNWLCIRSSIVKDGQTRSREATVSHCSVSSRLSAPPCLANLVCFAMLPPSYSCAWSASLTEAQSKVWTERRWTLKAWSSDVLPLAKPLLDYPKQHRHAGVQCSNGWAFRGHFSIKLPQMSIARKNNSYNFWIQSPGMAWVMRSFLLPVFYASGSIWKPLQWLIPVTYMTHVP